MPGEVSVHRISAEDTRPIRLCVLRPGQPSASAVYDGDKDATSVHLGAHLGGTLVGIASLYLEPRPGGAARAGWRLRGMATLPSARGRGAGRALVEEAVRHVADQGGGELWCNARASAIGFYAAAGFEIVGEPFDVPVIGEHVVMRLAVPRSA